ncbi:transglycosylase SLT domain-containing protein [Cesiribacter andamanensis]|uniref:Membrane-bound lytic murein transglycosylase D n=1 Tax=Cesiribacter andamanensis AMV16 TaxID=1279009 RepID=M7NND4_9BACT|nr:transglycosylase SLT domain-containing protein [Cesiribacter andamanensis]EMR03235.1 Membrane-bound lytic murein transglycosylase D precursor [Cesiribacter andamanensis AMV16]
MRYFLLTGLLIFSGCTTKDTTPPREERGAEVLSSISSSTEGSSASHPQYVTLPPIPSSVTFAGEEVPLHREDVREALENELIVNTFRHSRTLYTIKTIERWRPLIEQTLQENGVPQDFIYLAVAESEFDNNAVSFTGAMGMWQFMEATAKDYGLQIDKDVDMRRDPKLATEAASRYLKWAHGLLNNWTLVAASYNRGVSGMQNALKDQQADSFWDLHLNPETARYVYRIIAFKLILENPERYGYFLPAEEQYKPYRFITQPVEQDIDNLVAFARQHNTTYKELRQLNPWFNNTSNYKLSVPKKGRYEIRLPDRGEGGLGR